ncbi:GAF and ANTAR domain-containing protein [Rhodococcus chondri]|uniref:GAF and ANTAR domain-containing protein n=1 Tax=Rhodococcus chondri TaxID=3065941 RepID=A0ABU7JXH8_9NOCA|nr:GAF and ANTAR domain-containing protein [Rhodococcus sp. CC-R104]MEE2034614.1 GAF and ANTAR domain-containing protein [Rhodococcus sp. CC-R104]
MDADSERGSGDPAAVFAAMADLVYREAEPDQVYEAICSAATQLVPRCDHASVMMRRRNRYVTVAAGDDIARQVDDLERETGQGACLDAIEHEHPQIEPDLRTGSPWPRFAARVLAETPVRGAMSFRLHTETGKIGALNLFTDTPGGFTATEAAQASVLASFAAVTTLAVSRGETLASLRDGLSSNREIGKAIGLLIVLHHIGDDEAFELLRSTSQQMNVKVADLARTLNERHLRDMSDLNRPGGRGPLLG